MLLLCLAVLLPGVYWDQGPDAAAALRQAGVEKLYVPAGQEDGWKKLGFDAKPFDEKQFEKLEVPGVQYRMDQASATRVPWIDANGWRIQRDGQKLYYYDLAKAKGKAALAAAEANAYGAESVIRPAQEDLEPLGRMIAFLKQKAGPQLPVMANIGVVKDSSETTAEVLNLMARHNLLFKVVDAPDPKLDLNIRIGSKEYPESEAADPYEFAMKVRRQLTDAKRLARIYGSEVVLIHLTGKDEEAQLHVLNYSSRKVEGLRVRVLGTYRQGTLEAFGKPDAKLLDFANPEGGTEFTLPEMNSYAIVRLKK